MQRDAWTDPISASLETLPGGESLPADLGKLLQQLVQASAAEGAGTDSNAADELRDSLSSLGISIEALQRHNPGSFGSKTLDDVWEMMAPQRLDGDTSDARLSQVGAALAIGDRKLLDQAAQLLPELSSLVPSTLPTPASLQMPSHLPPHAGEATPHNPAAAAGVRAGLPSRAASPSLAGFRYRGVSLGPPGGPGSLTPPAHSLGLEVRPGAHPVNASPFQLSSAPGPRAASPLSRPEGARSSKRAIKNRESAARSRARRQEYTQTLEAKVAELQEANRLLREQVGVKRARSL
ncbi:Protein FD [Auxenochlorella protothecoides]|uniref:Protein FD n=1 Tax=Auxenochlorella protothecoides TaxID=3075 RepID=A0A087SCW3_AUXPR|nr:Protein FD [Auxenochlorella protothecoides]KFM23567.1 Protein FD [Auxenochlorella protothecoides]